MKQVPIIHKIRAILEYMELGGEIPFPEEYDVNGVLYLDADYRTMLKMEVTIHSPGKSPRKEFMHQDLEMSIPALKKFVERLSDNAYAKICFSLTLNKSKRK